MRAAISLLLAGSLLTACNSDSSKQDQLVRKQQATIDSMKMAIAKQAVIDSMNKVHAREANAARQQNEAEINQLGNPQATASGRTAPASESRKGWNHTAKGALVGAGTGAITGAVINKNRAEGAIVGTLVGAGIGAGTGAIVDASKKKKSRKRDTN